MRRASVRGLRDAGADRWRCAATPRSSWSPATRDRENAVKAVGLGAYDFYQKPVDTDVLHLIVDRALPHLRAGAAEPARCCSSRGRRRSTASSRPATQMLQVCRMIEKVAPTTATTLLLGESGTGKEVLARALHYAQPAPDQQGLRRDQLRRDSGEPARERAVRPRARRLHRRRQADAGQDRARRRRHAVPRRDRRHAAGAAGQAAALPAGARGRAGRRPRARSRSTCASSAPPTRTCAAMIATRRVPRRPVLPHQRE